MNWVPTSTPVWQRRYEPSRALPNFSPHQMPWAAGGSALGVAVDQ
ncbi:hypothetical protein ACFVXG_39385 [Kitasatospora sp. NPDC058162]